MLTSPLCTAPGRLLPGDQPVAGAPWRPWPQTVAQAGVAGDRGWNSSHHTKASSFDFAHDEALAKLALRPAGHDWAVAPSALGADAVIHDQRPGQADIDAEFGRDFYDMIAARHHLF